MLLTFEISSFVFMLLNNNYYNEKTNLSFFYVYFLPDSFNELGFSVWIEGIRTFVVYSGMSCYLSA